MTYQLLDSGDLQKLERFGDFVLARPSSQALWKKSLPEEMWREADALFTRDKGNRWQFRRKIPASWPVELSGITFKISPTEFGHLGIFPEHLMLASWIQERIQERKKSTKVLNLFAYTGALTLAAAQAGAQLCHLDASKGVVAWARENAKMNQLEGAPIRWIVEDVVKFLRRELKRGAEYDAIILDPPTFGRGNKGEIFKVDRDLWEILDLCAKLLSKDPLFVLFTSHTPGMTPLVLHHLLSQMLTGRELQIESGELLIRSKETFSLPCGAFVRGLFC